MDAVGYLASPSSQSEQRPGVLVAHEGPGLGAHAEQRAEMLAELGYVALAADLYGGGHVAPTHEATRTQVAALRKDRAVLRRRIMAALAALRSLPDIDPSRVAAVGYCFGGMAVLELARAGEQVAGIVCFHGLLDAGAEPAAGRIGAPILVCTGADDMLVPPDQVNAFEREMSEAGADWQVIRYGGAGHAFTNYVEQEELARRGFAYNATADRRSWSAMRQFLSDVFTDGKSAPCR